MISEYSDHIRASIQSSPPNDHGVSHSGAPSDRPEAKRSHDEVSRGGESGARPTAAKKGGQYAHGSYVTINASLSPHDQSYVTVTVHYCSMMVG